MNMTVLISEHGRNETSRLKRLAPSLANTVRNMIDCVFPWRTAEEQHIVGSAVHEIVTSFLLFQTGKPSLSLQ